MKLRYITILMAVLVLAVSCEREDVTDPGVTILEGIKKDPELTTLAQAIDKAGLKEALKGTQYTFFAPTDQAFTNAGININNMDATQLLKILQYHMIPSRIDSARFDIEYGKFFNQITTSGTYAINWIGTLTYQGFQTLNLDVNANIYSTHAIEVQDNTNGILKGRGVFFNGASIQKFDAFEGADGVVHKIDRVLLPPVGNAAQAIAADSDLSLFNKLVNKASANANGLPNFAATTLSPLPADALTNARTGTLTVLAPTNAAMQAEGFDEAYINGLTPAAALTIANRHVVSLRYFTSDFFNQLFRNTPATTSRSFATLQGGFNVTYNNTGTAQFFSSTGAANSAIVQSDIVTTNGVIHKIGTVLD